MASPQDQVLEIVRKEFGPDADNLPDSTIQAFIHCIRSDDTGNCILKSLIDAKALCAVNLELKNDFANSTPATASLLALWRQGCFVLCAEQINRKATAEVKLCETIFGPKCARGTLWYDNIDDLLGPCAVYVRGNTNNHHGHHGHHDPQDHTMEAWFYRPRFPFDYRLEKPFAFFKGEIEQATTQDFRPFSAKGNGMWQELKQDHPH
jgi:hypothetical protein